MSSSRMSRKSGPSDARPNRTRRSTSVSKTIPGVLASPVEEAVTAALAAIAWVEGLEVAMMEVCLILLSLFLGIVRRSRDCDRIADRAVHGFILGSSYGRNGGGGSGSGGSSFRDSTPRPASFDEYDAGDDEDRTIPTPSARAGAAAAARSSISSRATPARTGSGQSVVAKGREEQKKAQAPPPKAVDLFDFGDDDLVSASPVQGQSCSH